MPDATPPPTVTTVTVTTATTVTSTITTRPIGEILTFRLNATFPTDENEIQDAKDNIITAIVNLVNSDNTIPENMTANDIVDVELHPGSIIAIINFFQNAAAGLNASLLTAINSGKLIVNVGGFGPSNTFTAENVNGPPPTTTTTTTTVTSVTATTVTTTTRVVKSLDCCSLVVLNESCASQCTTVEFFIPVGSTTGECVMDCPEGCCTTLVSEVADTVISTSNLMLFSIES